jgi:FKBP-type peptidyl-prolyl cis-trans isomerase
MKRINYLLVVIAAASFLTACKNVNYRKTKSGLLYKIFSGNGSGPLVKEGNVVKYDVTYKLNEDSVLYTSYGKAPMYNNVREAGAGSYNLAEIFPLMRQGDSAVTVQMLDSLVKKGAQIPFKVNKGDRLVSYVHIVKVFPSDSLARPDFNAEMEKDKPRQMKEQEEQAAKVKKQQMDEMNQAIAEYEKSGEAAKGVKQMQDWLAAKKINAKQVGSGTFVSIQDPGTGAPAQAGKFVQVKYTGKIIRTDSVFEANIYPNLQLGIDPVIKGWEEGLEQFKQGGKGTIYIPGFLAYGNSPNSMFKPFEALKFDVEILEVSDKAIEQKPQPQAPQASPSK